MTCGEEPPRRPPPRQEPRSWDQSPGFWPLKEKAPQWLTFERFASSLLRGSQPPGLDVLTSL